MTAPSYITGDVPPADDFNHWFVNNNFVTKSSATSITSSTTLVDDPHLTLPVDASTTYMVNMVLRADGATAGDIKFQFTVPSGAKFYGSAHSLNGTATDTSSLLLDAITETLPKGYGVLSGTVTAINVSGILVTATTAGALTVQWAQNVSNGTPTRVNLGSYLDLVRKA